MRWLLILLALAGPALADRYTYTARVVSVYDGDTATVDIDLGFDVWLTSQDLRFYCINAPEVRGLERTAGLAVRDEVRGWLVPGQMITIQTVQDRSEKYGRWLALITPSGWTETVNARLLREGKVRIEAYSPAARQACRDLLGVPAAN